MRQHGSLKLKMSQLKNNTVKKMPLLTRERLLLPKAYQVLVLAEINTSRLMKRKHLNRVFLERREANKASRFFMNFYAGEVHPGYALEKLFSVRVAQW